MEKGTRVGAILSKKDNVVYFLGYGTYEGHEIPVGAGGTGQFLVEMNKKNPKIRLDNGDIIWGCECWWGYKEEIDKQLRDMKIINIRIKDYR